MRGWWALVLVGCSGTATPEALRRAWLVDTLTDDNRIWEGRWDELAEKYAAMGDDPYDYMRGSLAVFSRDLDRAGALRSPTGFLSVAGATSVLLVGDPHPENIGTFLPGEGPGPVEGLVPLRLEFNDFDGSGFGPYLVDVRRAVLGLLVLLDGAGYDRPALEDSARAFTEAYVAALEGAVSGAASPTAIPTERGEAIDHLWSDVSAEGLAREQLLEATEQVGEGRRFRLGVGELVALTAEQHAQLDRLLAGWDAPAGFRVLDRARRENAGIASLPALRYAVAWDRGAPGPEDDELLQLREVVDPPALPDGVVPPGSFDSNPERSVSAALLLWSRPDADVRLGGVHDGSQAFKTQTWSSFQESVDHEKAARDLAALRTADAEGFARVLGGVLGGAHARTVTHELEPALPALWSDLRGRTDAFVEERVAEALPDLDRTLDDHALLVSALDELGPLLGAYGR